MVRLLSVLLVIPLVASCTSIVEGTAKPGVSLEKAGPAGTVPAGLEKYYGQQLGWQDCAPFATTGSSRSAFGNKRDVECTRLQVPLDYAKPDGDTITVGVLRYKATGEKIGSLLINPGGPGASGMAAAAGMVSDYRKTDLAKRFDLVGFDPRGVGASEPAVKCLTGPERDAERLDLDIDTSPAGIAQTEQENKAYAEKCAAGTKFGASMLANLGTRDVVKDMDVLRSALGDAKLSYVGYSYGTRIGTEYAETFPQNVRALILDGAVDPTQDQLASLVAQAAGFQKAFNEFVKWCKEKGDCPLGDDANTSFRQLTTPLIQKPVTVGDRKLSYNDAITAAIQALYSEQLWPLLLDGLKELKNGRGRVLISLADAYLDRDDQGNYSTITDSFNAVHCVDDQRLTDKNALLDTAKKYKEAAPFLDDGNPPGAALDSCAFWPAPVSARTGPPKADGIPPLLVISTTGDPATPYEAGVNLAKALNSRLLTYEGVQHTVFLQGVGCVDNAGVKYLIDQTLPADGTRCA
ncbi:alpha/beta hydrolase [Lentzea sp. BCCO 10_0856]|uniref:Alpha/beta hydrolase n=1 Tax=Lentzea miocenica TaxID=3095431 RepID=A0ABU4TFP8_9PSEU|nr:alpha/beta hydrolase [Lentzea sp. BCCO 10_0856]MDX8037024.1 alpha/beta hydrolase [Lentzea sp. BCCO 10_0856]